MQKPKKKMILMSRHFALWVYGINKYIAKFNVDCKMRLSIYIVLVDMQALYTSIYIEGEEGGGIGKAETIYFGQIGIILPHVIYGIGRANQKVPGK